MGLGIRILAVVFVALALGATPASLADEPSTALAAVPGEWHASNQHYEVFLTAPVQGGSVGWCLVDTTVRDGGFGCSLAA